MPHHQFLGLQECETNENMRIAIMARNYMEDVRTEMFNSGWQYPPGTWNVRSLSCASEIPRKTSRVSFIEVNSCNK